MRKKRLSRTKYFLLKKYFKKFEKNLKKGIDILKHMVYND